MALPADGNGEDTEDTEGKPPKYTHFLLGTMAVKTEGETTTVTLAHWGGGMLRLAMVATDYRCVAYSPGDPAANPPVPEEPGGIQTTYTLTWQKS
ncbi:MAG: hypothetical protein LBK99_09385 [Opitutaceae bacterium]|jgi:hypothetical protein|nr:hypothetical protein [Opitutaceae bacterium]